MLQLNLRRAELSIKTKIAEQHKQKNDVFFKAMELEKERLETEKEKLELQKKKLWLQEKEIILQRELHFEKLAFQAFEMDKDSPESLEYFRHLRMKQLQKLNADCD